MLEIIFIIFGLALTVLPTYYYLYSSQGDGSIIPLYLIAILVSLGIITFSIGVKNLYKKFRRKIIAKMGDEAVATFVDMEEKKISKNSLYAIKFFFTDDNGNIVNKKTTARFRFQQAYYFKTLYHFKIKYIGRHAVISEPLDADKVSCLPTSESQLFKSFKTIPSNGIGKKVKIPKLVKGTIINSTKKYSKPFSHKQYFVCDYCGYIQDSPGRCLSCGARISLKK